MRKRLSLALLTLALLGGAAQRGPLELITMPAGVTVIALAPLLALLLAFGPAACTLVALLAVRRRTTARDQAAEHGAPTPNLNGGVARSSPTDRRPTVRRNTDEPPTETR